MDSNVKGSLIIVSAPSGAGKSTLIKGVMAELPDLQYSISYTTREKRQGEENGRDYFFTDEQTFLDMAKKGQFLEYAKVFGSYYYGTSSDQILEALNRGIDVIMDIDVQGACQIMENDKIDYYSVFVLPPSLDILEKRLRNRARENQDEMQKRLQTAENELKYLSRFDYLVVNDSLKESISRLKSIVQSERRKINRISDTENFITIFKGDGIHGK